MTRYIIILFLCFGSSSIFAQDIQKDFSKVYNQYLKIDHLSMDLLMQSYQNGSKLNESMTGLVRKSEGKYYSKFGQNEFIGNDKEVIVVNHNLKSISYYGKGLPKNEASTDQYLQQLNEWLAKGNTVKLLKKEGDKKTYKITLPKDELLKSVELQLDMKKLVVSKIIYHYKDVEEVGLSKMVLTYKNISFSEPSNSFFVGTKYLQKEKGTVKLKKNYQKYKLYIQK